MPGFEQETLRKFIAGGFLERHIARMRVVYRARLAALTETPWPYPHGGPTGPALGNLPVRVLEDLPDYSLPSPHDNLRLLEAVLRAHGRTPVYVDLTRDDFAIPVVRALVPGLELNADWDRFSRPSLRLMARR